MTKKWVIIGIIVSVIAILFLVNRSVFEEGVKDADIHEIVQFMEDMKNGKEGEITVARQYFGGKASLASDAPKEAEGWLIYHLKSHYDEKTKESWIEVIPDLSRFKQSPDLPIEIITSPEQCSYISYKRDLERDTGKYMLTECTHRWEYELP
ncbi:hypothetical protein KFD70_23390 [Bacillus pfraonensis]|uniref:hypothetical protein n=1 Tax=Bacillus TaxID=1386 RepID=UPI002A51FF9C|nr:hypothetical protein [Bacillus pseudomycoides]